MDRSPPTEAELAAREASAPEPPLDPRILDDVVVAASDSKHPERADFICDGSNDVAVLASAVAAVVARGKGSVRLLGGNYYLSRLLNEDEPELVYCSKHDLYDCWLAH